jgi:hypothetical protein
MTGFHVRRPHSHQLRTAIVSANWRGWKEGPLLPPVWNHHFLFEGCGGNCGSVTSTSVNAVDAAEALGLGYAVVNTDTGHEQDPATILLTWAVSDSTPPVVNAPAIIDFYYRAVHQVTVAAKQYVLDAPSQPRQFAVTIAVRSCWLCGLREGRTD